MKGKLPRFPPVHEYGSLRTVEKISGKPVTVRTLQHVDGSAFFFAL